MEILRDEYLDYMLFKKAERPLFVELMGPLIGLDAEWRAQGATEEEINLTAFGFDHVPVHGLRVNAGILGGEDRVIEEDAERVIRMDRYGRRTMLCKQSATIPLPLDHPVTDMDSWLKIKPRYGDCEQRMAEGCIEAARQARSRGELVVAFMPGGFDEPRQLMGEEALCMAYYDEPELIHDMLDTIGGMVERLLEKISREVQVDQLSVHEDLAGKTGSLVGPPQITEFIKPYYRRVWDLLQSRGARIFQQDSDGNMNAVLPAFLDAGLTCSYPMEPAAGMDVVEVRKTYGTRLAMLGGIDKHVLRKDREAIRAELEYKLQPMMRGGGMVFGLDHRIPNGTPLANYRYYVKTAREILGLDPVGVPGWSRMAF
ncbi:MAG: uroporphyrinogen decarboxylase family protein [Chthoniobacteraceae bacterium]|nr:uroporphyrinogen decarboxylase family protein [Chthoniobacteraceae bacterium]